MAPEQQGAALGFQSIGWRVQSPLESLNFKQCIEKNKQAESQDNAKLVTVTRADLSDGYKAVQSTHAAINFIFEHPGRAGPWFHNSNYLIELEAKDENELKHLIHKCEYHQLAYTVFREPDIGNQITAIAIEPSKQTQKLVRKIPLLFKNKII